MHVIDGSEQSDWHSEMLMHSLQMHTKNASETAYKRMEGSGLTSRHGACHYVAVTGQPRRVTMHILLMTEQGLKDKGSTAHWVSEL